VSRSVGRAIGLDVHRDFCEVAICEAGRVRSAGRIKTSPDALELFACSLGPEDRVALEVTGGAWEIAGILEGYVRRVVVVSPDDTGIRRARAKTDRLDARTLAGLLWAGELDAVWMPDERWRVMRRRLARREQLVRSRSRAKNEIHAVLMRRLRGTAARVGPVRGQGTQGGCASSSCPSRRQRRSAARCATSSSSTQRSPRSSGSSPARRCARRTHGG
jgi:transposase